ncbi:MAG: hypothetical protein D6782_02990, partial [Alphaproteobacteria bacterium]
MATVQLKPIDQKEMEIMIQGVTPLIQHKWSEKALREMREKQSGRKTKTREPKNPQKEAEAATYFTKDGRYGVPLLAIKAAIIGAAHKDIGIEKTLVRKSLFIKDELGDGILPMDCDEPVIREDCVRVGSGSADLRYRPQFNRWAVKLRIVFDAENLRPDDIVNLINRAGFGVGIGEWRPEK